MKMKVNISRLEEIVGDDEPMKKMLIGMFLDTCNRTSEALEKSLGLNGEEAKKIWKAKCHELKGAAANLGFEDLTVYCKKIEDQDMEVDEKKKTIEILKSARNKVKEIFDSL